ncbi:hypothetical protein FPANT_2438 [Fusarium pseudoanthophilum]|uniref:Uncharacterized protein n=1 Tax=Fusarium pseudoanthophilum TaxID=48495 RepID=A0A8H5UW61_9HYPO|nr:hypothetical protein FPANT_2438 [Fusarium pseudoanthophilum]
MSNAHQGLDASNVDPTDSYARKAFLSAKAGNLNCFDYAKFKMAEAITTVVSYEHLARAGFVSASEQSFYFDIDRLVWDQYFSILGNDAPECPWMRYEGSSRDDHIGPVSDVYQQWRQDHGLPIVGPYTQLDVPD